MKIFQKLNSFVIIILVGFGILLPTSVFSEGELRLNFIAGVKGKVEILYHEQEKYQTAFVGTFLHSDDKVLVPKGAFGEIACDNGKKWILSPGEFRVSQGCKYTDRPIFRRKPPSTTPTRGVGKDANIPYLISPRNTAIMTSTPTLEWNPIAGAKKYKVQINNWETEVIPPKVVYAGEKLKAYTVYKVKIITVRADISPNSDDDQKTDDDQGFVLLDPDKINSIETNVEKLQGQTFTTEARSFALALFYRSNDLNNKAIDELERSVKAGSKITAIYKLLGDIYQEIGLNSLAKARYDIGLNLARNEGNLETQESIQIELEKVSKALEGV
jgi:hypothetical protein